MCERDIKTNARPQEFYRAGTAPPVLKFLDPPLMFHRLFTYHRSNPYSIRQIMSILNYRHICFFMNDKRMSRQCVIVFENCILSCASMYNVYNRIG